MRVLITGANGFIGKNLRQHLSELENIQVKVFNREDHLDSLPKLLEDIDFVFHLAGVNRPNNLDDFACDNVNLTNALCEAIAKVSEINGRKIVLIYTSSEQANENNPYGLSKKEGENKIFRLNINQSIPVYVFRLPNIFGKWCRPNYNSVVATFCHNIANNGPIVVNDSNAIITLVYIDDLIECFLQIIQNRVDVNSQNLKFITSEGYTFSKVSKEFRISVGELADIISSFKNSRDNLKIGQVGKGLMRALYATYVSYLPANNFTYKLTQKNDSRGKFVEFVKTLDSGQFSYLTVLPGATRGGHYHHSKSEKFLVVKGQALFKFLNIQNGHTYEYVISDKKNEVVETVPGWAHDITNIGIEEVIVLLWSNEVFDPKHPDTFNAKLR